MSCRARRWRALLAPVLVGASGPSRELAQWSTDTALMPSCRAMRSDAVSKSADHPAPTSVTARETSSAASHLKNRVVAFPAGQTEHAVARQTLCRYFPEKKFIDDAMIDTSSVVPICVDQSRRLGRTSRQLSS
jgi:hypothetical protein